jgi:hypothetical protein
VNRQKKKKPTHTHKNGEMQFKNPQNSDYADYAIELYKRKTSDEKQKLHHSQHKT